MCCPRLPLYHIFAFTVNFLGFFIRGAHNILIPSPRPLTNLRKAPMYFCSGKPMHFPLALTVQSDDPVLVHDFSKT
jgi:hypothetical protein